jgi:hypothetical protein
MAAPVRKQKRPADEKEESAQSMGQIKNRTSKRRKHGEKALHHDIVVARQRRLCLAPLKMAKQTERKEKEEISRVG